MSEGWFKVHRSMLEHPVLQDGERFKAWCWLLSEAAWRDTRKDIKGKTIAIKRGQVAHSTRFMAGAWGWSESAVRRFLKRLKTDAMIDAATDAGQTIITICNYCKYQDQDELTDAATDAATDAGATQERRKLEEGKKERTTKHTINGSGEMDVEAEFSQFWNEVPRKVGRGQAVRAYKAARKKSSGLEILAGMKAYAKTCVGKDPQYVCHPATWLNGERWLDEAPRARNGAMDVREGKSLWEQAGEDLNA